MVKALEVQCARRNSKGVCVSGICLCPKCGAEKWCYAAREPNEDEPPCLQCRKAQEAE